MDGHTPRARGFINRYRCYVDHLQSTELVPLRSKIQPAWRKTPHAKGWPLLPGNRSPKTPPGIGTPPSLIRTKVRKPNRQEHGSPDTAMPMASVFKRSLRKIDSDRGPVDGDKPSLEIAQARSELRTGLRIGGSLPPEPGTRLPNCLGHWRLWLCTIETSGASILLPVARSIAIA